MACTRMLRDVPSSRDTKISRRFNDNIKGLSFRTLLVIIFSTKLIQILPIVGIYIFNNVRGVRIV
jgi:hypothetical protein